MNDEVSTAITAPGGTVLRDEAHGVETEEEIVETEEGSVDNHLGVCKRSGKDCNYTYRFSYCL